MKSGKEDETSMEPLFPRLHVNDTAHLVGGPRAPPRNKMALYEQLTRPIPSRNTSGVQSSLSAQQGCAHENQNLSPFYMPQVPAHFLDSVTNYNPTGTERSANQNSSRIMVGARSIAESSSARQNESNTRDSRGKNIEISYYYRIPHFDRQEPGEHPNSKKEKRLIELTKLTPFGNNNPHKTQIGMLGASAQNVNSRDKPFESSTSNFKSINIGRSVGKNMNNPVLIREFDERSDNDKIGDRSNTSKASLRKDVTTGAWKSLQEDSISSHNSHHMKDVACNNRSSEDLTHSMELLCSKNSPARGCRTSNLVNKFIQDGEVNMPSNAKEKDLAAETSMGSIPNLEITPDNVVVKIGSKHFWKARRAIVNQQRVFSIQVFELHRLIKVQKLIAGSPHLLLEGIVQSKSSHKAPTNIPVSDSNVNSQMETVRQKDNSQKQHHEIEVATENLSNGPPCDSFPNHEEIVNRDLEGLVPNNSSAIVPPIVAAPDNQQGAWCYHPPSNQWLVAVMSPSEGLLYKPCASLCTPGGFMAPLYGSCTPHDATMVSGNFLNQVYGVPPPHRPPNNSVNPNGSPMMQNYYPGTFVLPTVNPLVSNSAVEQASYLDAPQAGGQTDQHSGSSCNMPNARSEAFSTHVCRFQASKDSELQGSTASSQVHTDRNYVSPLFPRLETPTNLASSTKSRDRSNQTRVIKVVPLNARSASESAARIFRSIQEERQQIDS